MQANAIKSNQGLTLSLLWIFVVLSSVFCVLHEMAKASAIEKILSGLFWGTHFRIGAVDRRDRSRVAFARNSDLCNCAKMHCACL